MREIPQLQAVIRSQNNKNIQGSRSNFQQRNRKTKKKRERGEKEEKEKE